MVVGIQGMTFQHQVKRARFDCASTLLAYGFSPTEKLLLHASYQVAKQFKSNKPHAVGKKLISHVLLKWQILK